MFRSILILLLLSSLFLSACVPQDAQTPPTSDVGDSKGLSPTDTQNHSAFQETVITDNDHFTFKVTAIDETNSFGYTLKVFLENKTDLNLMFSLDKVSVNGFMCDPFWATSVASGMKANEKISFSSSDFADNGITEVFAIEFTLKVYDNDNWTAEPLLHDTFAVYPHGENAVTEYARTPAENETVLFDDENCTMIIAEFQDDPALGYVLIAYLENKTDNDLMFSIDSASVNGYMCDPLWAVSVAAGKRSNTRITWSKSILAENAITDVTDLVLPVRVYNEDDWMEDPLIDMPFKVTPTT